MTNAEKNQVIIAARIAAFKAKMDSSAGTWHRDDVLLMICFLMVIGASDNIAKNFYPYTFGVKKIKDGVEITLDDKKFRLRNDDLDSIMPSDNQGLDRKPYYLEWFDRYEDGQYIINAAEGAFIALWWRAYFGSTADRGFVVMRQLLQGLEDLGGKSTQNHLDNLMAWYDKYYTKIKEAFPAMLVNEDMMRYERARVAQLSGTKGTYSEVNPLRQELGDHMITDRGWMKKRLVYIMSMASYGDFAHEASSGTITFRLNGNATFDLTPAINMYPTVTGGQTTIRGARTAANTVCQLQLSGTDLDSMVNGADYLLDIGEWYNKPIRNNLTVNARMLKNLVLGTDDATKIQNMAITISQLTVGVCPSLRVLDVRNISTLTGEVDLSNCRLLSTVYAEGTSLTSIKLSNGSPITTLQVPTTLQKIELKHLPLLTESGFNYMDCALSVTSFLASNCTNLPALKILVDIINAQQNSGSTPLLHRVYVDGFNETYDDNQVLESLKVLMDGYQAIDIEGYDIAGLPILSGTITMTCPVYEDTVQTLQEAFGAGGLVINYTNTYIRFEDDRVKEICAYNWGYTYDLQEVNGQGGVLDTGELEGNGDTMAYCDHIFACSTAIGAHGTVPATSARTVQYRLELVVEGGRALDGTQAPWDIATAVSGTASCFYPVQYSSAMAATGLNNITCEQWVDSSFWASQTILVDDGMVSATARKYHAIITTTNAAQYLRLGIRAVAGTTISYKFVSVGVTKVPSSITSAQCAAVTSLSSTLNSSMMNQRRFPELRHFTKITTIGSSNTFASAKFAYIDFRNITNFAVGTSIDPTNMSVVSMPNVTTADCFPRCKTSWGDVTSAVDTAFYFPKLNTLGIIWNNWYSRGKIRWVVMGTENENLISISGSVTVTGGNNAFGKSYFKGFFVPDDLVDTYKTTSPWSNAASKIFGISEFETRTGETLPTE